MLSPAFRTNPNPKQGISAPAICTASIAASIAASTAASTRASLLHSWSSARPPLNTRPAPQAHGTSRGH